MTMPIVYLVRPLMPSDGMAPLGVKVAPEVVIRTRDLVDLNGPCLRLLLFQPFRLQPTVISDALGFKYSAQSCIIDRRRSKRSDLA